MSKLLQIAQLMGKLAEIEDKGDGWHPDGYPGPNRWVMNQIDELMPSFIELDIVPTKMSQSCEGGLYLKWDRAQDMVAIVMEIYNTREIAYVIVDTGKIITSGEIEPKSIVPFVVKYKTGAKYGKD